MKIISRTYLEELIELIGVPDIKVITGVRRCGKSKLLELLFEYILKNIIDSNVIHIDYNKIDFEDLNDYHKLYDYVSNRYEENKQNFLLIDEVQMCNDFEKAINYLHAESKYDIYLTGSNAFLLSSDLATLFTGRVYELKLFPFSYKEYLIYHNLEDPINNFDGYIYDGGFAGSYLYPTQNSKYNYIRSIYERIIEKDLIKRKKIRNKTVLNQISMYLMDNVSNLTTITNIYNVLNRSSISLNDKTVSSYIDNLCQAFLFYKIKRYDIKGKKYLSTSDKYYLCDHSLKSALLGVKDMNYGRIMENIVAIELLRRGYEVYVGVLYKKEIDFVAIKRDEKIYIQVSDNISDPSTLEREVSPLLQIKDAYPKLLIARTKHDEYTYEGIRIIDIGKWLSNLFFK